MSRHVPTVQKFMTVQPHVVPSSCSIAEAIGLMRARQIRHLPVLDGEELKGIVSERDLALIQNLRGVDPEQVTVAEAMSTGVYHVAPDTPIDEVAAELARHRYGSALVVERNQLVGIFTMIDACRALGEVFSSRLAR